MELIIVIIVSRGVEVSDCGKYLVVAIREGCDPVNRLYYSDLTELPDGTVIDNG